MANIIEYEKLTSTNKFALENIKNLEKNCIIKAQMQDNGRGRFDRKWISDKKDNCYISFVLKPDLIYKDVFPNLTQYLSIILCDELKKYNTNPAIKWPNDVQINGKKIAGILSEISMEKNNFLGIVLGIGVNLNLDYENLKSINIPATSLNLEIKKKIDSKVFIENLADNFFENYEDFLQNGFVKYKERYISYCNFLGQNITIKNPEPTKIGIAKDVCDNGALKIASEKGEEIIFSGDVIITKND